MNDQSQACIVNQSLNTIITIILLMKHGRFFILRNCAKHDLISLEIIISLFLYQSIELKDVTMLTSLPYIIFNDKCYQFKA